MSTKPSSIEREKEALRVGACVCAKCRDRMRLNHPFVPIDRSSGYHLGVCFVCEAGLVIMDKLFAG